MTPWKVRASRYLLVRPWMRLREDDVVLPGGGAHEVHVVEYPDWACVVPITDRGTVVLVEQYRHGVGRTLVEPPGGVCEPGEAPVAAARRELMEETGYAADEWTLLGAAAPDPVRFTNRATLFVAAGARRVREPSPDPAEHLRVHEVPIDELPALFGSGAVPHAVHLLAFAWARERGFLPRL